MKVFTLMAISLIICSCQSDPEPRVTENVRPVVNSVGGTSIHSTQREPFRTEEHLKAYTLGRYIDPVDSSTMYESGVIYRIETPSFWNLQPQLKINSTQFSQAKPSSDTQDALQAEIEVKANEQRALYKYLNQAAQEATKNLSALEESSKVSQQLLDQNQLLKSELKKAQSDKTTLQEQVSQLQEKLKAVLLYQQKKEKSSIRSNFRRRK